MSRNLTTAVQNQLAASELEPFFAIKLGFDSGDVRLWTGYNDITISSETYQVAVSCFLYHPSKKLLRLPLGA